MRAGGSPRSGFRKECYRYGPPFDVVFFLGARYDPTLGMGGSEFLQIRKTDVEYRSEFRIRARVQECAFH